MDDSDFERFVDEAFAFMEEAIKTCNAVWDFQSHERFDVDQDSGLLTFSEGPKPPIVCGIQFVGTYQTERSVWRWSWANPSIDDHLKARLRLVQDFGISNEISAITTDAWETPSEETAWAMTAIATKLLDGKSAYRAPEGPLHIFMVITDVDWLEDLQSGRTRYGRRAESPSAQCKRR